MSLVLYGAVKKQRRKTDLLRLRAPLILTAASAALMLAGCVSNSPMKTTAGYAPADPVLPETVDALPSGVAGDAMDGANSLAREMEKKGGDQSAAAPQIDATPATAVAEVPTSERASGAVVASLAPVSEAETPAVASIRGIAPTKPAPDVRVTETGSVEARSSELDDLMGHYADYYGVPEELVRRVAKRESTFNPRAKNGPYLGLMQISLPTARGMGYRGGREGLLDAETNLKYAVRYLRGAFVVAGGNHDRADRLYQSGYYYHAKRAGLLDETGVGTDRKRRRARG